MTVRVLHLLCDFNGGGAERLVLDLCRHGAPEVHTEVAVLHRRTTHGGPDLRAAFAAAGVRVHDLDRRRGGPGGLATARLARLARGFDLVHTHLWSGDLWGRLGAALAGVPAVSTEHNTVAEAPWRRALSRRSAPLCRRIVCVSGGARDALRAAGWPDEQLVVIENGVDLRRFAGMAARRPAPRPAEALRLLGVGRLVPQKGFDLLLPALRALPGFRLDLLGAGEERGRLQAASAGLDVHFHGQVDDVRPHLAAADLLVAPSRWEGFGLAAVEAMAAGLPVVGSEVPGLAEVLGAAALRLPPGDPAAWTAALRRLAADAPGRAALSRAGLAQAARFDIQRTADRHAALYRAVLAAAAPRR